MDICRKGKSMAGILIYVSCLWYKKRRSYLTIVGNYNIRASIGDSTNQLHRGRKCFEFSVGEYELLNHGVTTFVF